MNNTLQNLIHIGKILTRSEASRYLYLRKSPVNNYRWYEIEPGGEEKDSGTEAGCVEEAIRLAMAKWKSDGITLIHCGFRYTLPERDEHGINALFYQMVASYSSLNGVYFDETLGNNCFVQNASLESRILWKTLAEQRHG